MPGGRKSKWDELEMDEKLPLIEAWCRDGATDKDIFERLGISSATFYQWKLEKPELVESLKRGKEITDIKVENALLKKALGFKETVKKAVKVKDVQYSDAGKKLRETEKVILADEEVFVPPDTTAQIFWLKNRKPRVWRDKQEVVNITQGELELLTVEELDARIEELKAETQKLEDKQ